MIQKVWLVIFLLRKHLDFLRCKDVLDCVPKIKDREKFDCGADKTETSSWQLLVPEWTTVQCVDLQDPCRCWEAPTMGLPRGGAASTECSSPPDCFVHPASDSVASKATQSILWSSATVYAFRLLTCICLSFPICLFSQYCTSTF